MTLPTESSLDSYRDLDTWPLAQTLEAVVKSNAAAVGAVRRALPDLERAAAGIERCLAAGGRLIYLGAGTSGRLALQDAAELLPTFFERTVALLAGGEGAGERAVEDAEDDEDNARTRLRGLELTVNDAVVGIAASGSTPFSSPGSPSPALRARLRSASPTTPERPFSAPARSACFWKRPPKSSSARPGWLPAPPRRSP